METGENFDRIGIEINVNGKLRTKTNNTMNFVLLGSFKSRFLDNISQVATQKLLLRNSIYQLLRRILRNYINSRNLARIYNLILDSLIEYETFFYYPFS